MYSCLSQTQNPTSTHVIHTDSEWTAKMNQQPVTYTKSFLSRMKSSAADTVLKHWFVVMKKRAPILQTYKKTRKWMWYPPLICLSVIICEMSRFSLGFWINYAVCPAEGTAQHGACPGLVPCPEFITASYPFTLIPHPVTLIRKEWSHWLIYKNKNESSPPQDYRLTPKSQIMAP